MGINGDLITYNFKMYMIIVIIMQYNLYVLYCIHHMT